MDPDKKDYLSMLQEPISRLSTTSSVVKGFAATVVAGLAAISYTGISKRVLILSFLPIIAFTALDIYYLRLERKFRGLYNDVLSGEHEVDFSISLPKDKTFVKRAKANVWSCIKSPSIWLFYPVLYIVMIAVIILKCRGVI